MKLYVKSPCTVSEGPRWSAAERSLYWVDVTRGAYLRHRDGAAETEYEEVNPGLGKIGALVVRPQGRLWLFTSGCRVWECVFGAMPELKFTLEGHADRRFNDVWQDGAWCFCGVAAENGRPGELWRMSSDGEFTCIEPFTAGMPNGMGVSPDGTTFYFVVSDEKRIYAYAYDRKSGSLSNRHVVADDFAEPGIPDGMCVDPADGSLLIAFWDGARIERRGSGGCLLGTLRFPMPRVTSVETAGGRIFVTTANYPRDERRSMETGAGGVFVLDGNEIGRRKNTR